jgi:hypothetical protein
MATAEKAAMTRSPARQSLLLYSLLIALRAVIRDPRGARLRLGHADRHALSVYGAVGQCLSAQKLRRHRARRARQSGAVRTWCEQHTMGFNEEAFSESGLNPLIANLHAMATLTRARLENKQAVDAKNVPHVLQNCRIFHQHDRNTRK